MNRSSRAVPFEIFEQRIMLSLGPLHHKQYCTYSCPFCYVHADYDSYWSLTPEEIVDWVSQQNPRDYDIIYISGDTDSFAPPRETEAVRLAEMLAARFDADLFITTRAILSDAALSRLAAVAAEMARSRRSIFGCCSVAQYTQPQLEPRPIAPPSARIAQLRRFRDLDIVALLAIRPFLPNVPLSDYRSILDEAEGGIDVVLGEHWYTDSRGVLEEKVAAAAGPFTREDAHPSLGEMPFDSNEAIWRIYEMPQSEQYLTDECERRGVPFFMRSRPAIEWWRERR